MEKGLSTFVDYSTKETPKSVKLEEGKWYVISDGSYGTRPVKIVSMRKMGADDDLVIYFKWVRSSTFFGLLKSWNNESRGLTTFKAQLLDYGKLTSVDLIHPNAVTKKK